MKFWKKIVTGLIIFLVLFFGNYIYGWFDCYILTKRYYQDAEASFSQKEYVKALDGYNRYDKETDKYEPIGGYSHVVQIWDNPWAVPQSKLYIKAKQKIDEIINQEFTLDDCMTYFTQNIGRSNPYLGQVTYRIAELYEKQEMLEDAYDYYQLVEESFTLEPDLVQKARDKRIELGRKLGFEEEDDDDELDEDLE